jgi:hypothetical protein
LKKYGRAHGGGDGDSFGRHDVHPFVSKTVFSRRPRALGIGLRLEALSHRA